MATEDLVKENKVKPLPLTWPWLCAGLAVSACAVLATLTIDYALPEPVTRAKGHPEQFIAQIAYEHLVNLTAIGPRVAGSYENEVVSVGVLVSAIKSIAAQASVHNHVELDVQRASGSFALSFMDGMNNVYRDVQSVVARVRGAGGRERPRTAILLNCHFDTVPDSPGASDDGAGCAVMLDVLRALAATRRPLRHDAIFLFNGAEENILQASHAFITQHKWAKSVRAFINIEACGAGGREVMFQAGPHDPWIVEVYAGAVPHPFASSLAQELFQSGAIPADTDFRIFRDFGKLSGVDLAWSANGYVYHTRLDTPERVPPAALQRTGDNVLALTRGLLASDGVRSAVDPASRQPAFFDVLGLAVLAARAPAALALCAATLALLLLKIHLNARDARRRREYPSESSVPLVLPVGDLTASASAAVYLAYGAWWRQVGVAMAVSVLASAGGVAAAAGVAALLHALGARLAFYSRPLLLVPLYVAPGLAACWALAGALWDAWGGWAGRRGGWGARAMHDAGAALGGAALLACAACGLRSGFLPLLWTLLPAGADALGGVLRAPRGAAWALGAALPLLQTSYLLLNTLRMFVPIMGRAGAGALPPDVVMALLTAALVLTALSWLLPFVVATRDTRTLVCALAGACACAVGAALAGGALAAAPYSAERPQRLMLFHTRRTLHARIAPAATEHFYWVPELDANTRYTLDRYMGPAEEVSPEECARRVYCGVPYYLPVLGLVRRSHRVRASAAPLVRLEANVTVERRGEGVRALVVDVRRAPAHVVLVVAPARGVRLQRCSALAEPLAGAAWGERRTYFFALHAARAPTAWRVELELRGGGAALADVSLAGHALFGADKLHAEHARALAALPPHVAPTGWGVDLHLYEL
ncbi:unnamed protein product [Arctia plantaginis]|uniref:FXNA-like protease n=1 Tax=Arctia plantaginis TaxID=874455 RepID=A0A8S1ADE0_ARCPL|nr:unnamed protein product [Arctia plantaginis]